MKKNMKFFVLSLVLVVAISVGSVYAAGETGSTQPTATPTATATPDVTPGATPAPTPAPVK